jgi:hypothetical protein
MQKRIAVALVVAVVGLAAQGCGTSEQSPQAPGRAFRTPEDALRAFQHALAVGDHRGLAGALTDESRQVLTGSLGAEAAKVHVILKVFPPPDSPFLKLEDRLRMRNEYLAKLRPLDALSEKHDLDAHFVTRAFDEARGKGEEADRRALLTIARPIRAQAVFIEEALEALKTAGGKENLGVLAGFAEGTLTNATTSGDTARGQLVTRAGGSEKNVPVVFRRENGSWRLDLVQPFLKGKR